jgi:hypothetical protein
VDHRYGSPASLGLVSILQARGEVVVAVPKDGGGDGDEVADDPAGGIAPAVDLRLNFFDYNPIAALGRFHSIQLSRILQRVGEIQAARRDEHL